MSLINPLTEYLTDVPGLLTGHVLADQAGRGHSSVGPL